MDIFTKLQILLTKRPKIISLNNGKIKFKGKYWGSVGYDYRIDYPKKAFHVTEKFTYLHPQLMGNGMCGGDEATVEYTLKPLKSGLYRITEETLFRGEIEKHHIHYYLVW